jgi:hypothetical protein
VGIKITDMTDGAPVDGTEIIPTSKSAAPRRITTADIKTYVQDQIEAISAGTVVDGNDQIYILDNTDSALKPVDIDTVLQHIIDAVWAKSAEASPDDADVIMLLKDGSTEKTVTLSVLAEYVRATVEAAILDVSDLADGSGTLAVTDYMLVTQGTTAKQVTLQDVNDAIYTSLAAHVTGKAGVVTGVATDELYFVRGGTGDKITLAEIATYVGTTATIDGSGTTDFLAQWADSDTLQAGPQITDSADTFSAGSDSAVPTTAAVRGEMDEIINDATAIGAALAGTDTFLVDDGANGTQRKAAISRIKTYMETVGIYKEIYVDANQFVTPTTDPAASGKNEYGTNDIELEYFAFDGGATEERIQFKRVMPPDWDRSTIKVKFLWSSATGSTAADTVEWGIKAGSLGDDDAIDTALGTAQVISDALIASNGTDMQVTAATPALTVEGTPALGDMIVFEVYRNTDGTDDMVEDAWLFGVLIQYQATQTVAAW